MDVLQFDQSHHDASHRQKSKMLPTLFYCWRLYSILTLLIGSIDLAHKYFYSYKSQIPIQHTRFEDEVSPSIATADPNQKQPSPSQTTDIFSLFHHEPHVCYLPPCCENSLTTCFDRLVSVHKYELPSGRKQSICDPIVSGSNDIFFMVAVAETFLYVSSSRMSPT
jgi:hypothetical protein